MKKKNRIWICTFIVISAIFIFTNSCKKKNENNIQTNLSDIDGNIYHSVTIGTQTWMVENLKVNHYRNGNKIPTITDSTAWMNQTTGALCYYNNDVNNFEIYGCLYNWYAINDIRGICPAGWHVPTENDWVILVNYLGGDTVAGGKLKLSGTNYWRYPNTLASNTSGFSGLGGGYRDNNFADITYRGKWWSSDTVHLPGIPNSVSTWTMVLNYDNGYSTGYPYLTISDLSPIRCGRSIRCVKDN